MGYLTGILDWLQLIVCSDIVVCLQRYDVNIEWRLVTIQHGKAANANEVWQTMANGRNWKRSSVFKFCYFAELMKSVYVLCECRHRIPIIYSIQVWKRSIVIAQYFTNKSIIDQVFRSNFDIYPFLSSPKRFSKK